MHGRIKVRTSEEEKVRKELQRQEKLKQFRIVMANIYSKRQKNELDAEMLELTRNILFANADIYTLWNIRRACILELINKWEKELFNESNSENVDHIKKVTDIFDSELYLTECCLKLNPKSYCAWHQRQWVLTTRKDPDWKQELKICNLYLEYDSRNFHTWDYRRFIVSQYNIPLEDEFKFTTDKIMENFSNYSAWHYRSKLLVNLYPDEKGGRPIEDKHHKEELKLIQNAAFTDPDDTSSWYYQRWLLDAVKNEMQIIYCSVTPSEAIVIFNSNITLNDIEHMKLVVNNQTFKSFTSMYGGKIDVCWKTGLQFDELPANSDIELHFDSNIYNDHLILKYVNDNSFVEARKVNFSKIYSQEVVEELDSQLLSCKQLMELEPENRCALLAMTMILHNLDPIQNYNQIINNLKTLCTLDHKRSGYYNDIISKWTIENYLHKVNMGTVMPSIREMYDIKLTSLHYIQFWSFCKVVDFSGQSLSSRSLNALKFLFNCEQLDLSENLISDISSFPLLPKLKILILKNNPGLERNHVENNFISSSINLIL